MELSSRTILITGASRGIGEATARAFAEYPVNLVLLARSLDRLEQLADDLNDRPGVKALPVAADVSDAVGVGKAVGLAEKTFGRIDILINNAGVGMRSPVVDIDRQTARRLFEINYWGAINCIEAVLPGMRAREDGLIINISSIVGRRAMPSASIYCGSKFALNALSESMRVELHPYNIRVVSFYPGVTETGFNENELTGDATEHSHGRMRKTSAQQAGSAIVRAARREPRDAYTTWVDRFFVYGSMIAPGLFDRMLVRFYGLKE